MARIAFVSCNETPWGGSEELWARAALVLAEQGHDISVAKPRLARHAAPIRALRERGVRMVDLLRLRPVPARIFEIGSFLARPAMLAFQLLRLWFFLKRRRPDLIVLSQGGCWDGFVMEPVLRRFEIPYLLICQKAADLYWPPDSLRDRVQRFILGARHIFCVSQHNLDLLEQQIGAQLENAEVVRNPFLVDFDDQPRWPDNDTPIRLACIGRLYPMEKGQDLLLRVLAQQKWRERALTVDFYGEGIQRRGLEGMARLLGCENAVFHGHVEDIARVWDTHHGLVLPSRAEGLPLVLVETMLAGRVAIVSTAGGSAEVVEDDVTAFLMHGFDEAALDDALERAWQRRNEWRTIGQAAAKAIRQSVPRSPETEFARRVEAFVPDA